MARNFRKTLEAPRGVHGVVQADVQAGRCRRRGCLQQVEDELQLGLALEAVEAFLVRVLSLMHMAAPVSEVMVQKQYT